ncbi:MAG: hypothetical protein ABIY55_31920 [Kofleriaceae bacterium]
MTRMTHLLSALSLTGVLAAATIAACGGRPGAPGEMPPVAPRPDPIGEPGAPPALPAPSELPGDAGVSVRPGPVSVRSVPSPEFAPVTGQAAHDAGTSDGYAPPLPPLPDGGVPVDSQLEPR